MDWQFFLNDFLPLMIVIFIGDAIFYTLGNAHGFSEAMDFSRKEIDKIFKDINRMVSDKGGEEVRKELYKKDRTILELTNKLNRLQNQ